ncbi:MAG: hypothetical protein IPK71_07810 [Myxococcales bacterium]|nr:hypothetical protein [Myxococcales bacterium]
MNQELGRCREHSAPVVAGDDTASAVCSGPIGTPGWWAASGELLLRTCQDGALGAVCEVLLLATVSDGNADAAFADLSAQYGEITRYERSVPTPSEIATCPSAKKFVGYWRWERTPAGPGGVVRFTIFCGGVTKAMNITFALVR